MEGIPLSPSGYDWDWDTCETGLCEGDCIEVRRPVIFIDGKYLCRSCCLARGIRVAETMEQGELTFG